MCAPADCLLSSKCLAGVAAVRCVECTSSSWYWGTRHEINVLSTSGRVGPYMSVAANVIITKNTTYSLGRLGYCPACTRVPVTEQDLLGTQIWEEKNRDFYLILTRSFHLYIIMVYKEIPVSGYWRVVGFRHLRPRRINAINSSIYWKWFGKAFRGLGTKRVLLYTIYIF